MGTDAFIQRLRKLLSSADLELLLQGPAPPTRGEDYDPIFKGLKRKLRVHEERIALARERIERRYEEFEDLPEGRRLIVLRNSSPEMLVTLARDLMKRSFAERFGDLDRSLRLASLALKVVHYLGEVEHLSPESLADLRAEAWSYVGNARRINSDLPGAEKALLAAREAMDEGTGDRDFKADYFSRLAALRSSQGRSEEASVLIEREIALRRLLGDSERVGIALLDRGWIACWKDSPVEACSYLRRGVEIVNDPRLLLLGLDNLAEALARDGQGLDAYKVLCAADLVFPGVEGETVAFRHRWIKGLTYRALGELAHARKALEHAKLGFLQAEVPLQTALISLDLACVCAAEGRYAELRQLAEEAYAVFASEGLGRRALTVVLMLQRAAEAEELPERLAVEVANFLVRFQHNKSLRFKRPQ